MREDGELKWYGPPHVVKRRNNQKQNQIFNYTIRKRVDKMKMYMWQCGEFDGSYDGHIVIIAKNLQEAREIGEKGTTDHALELINSSLTYISDHQKEIVKDVVQREPNLTINIGNGLCFGLYGSN